MRLERWQTEWTQVNITCSHSKLIEQFLVHRLAEIIEKFATLFLGLEKLVEASHSVTELKKELAEKEKELEIASARAEEVLREVCTKNY